MKTAVDIYKLLPKTNCGTCGTPTCFGFAAKLATNQARREQCVNMSEAARANSGWGVRRQKCVAGHRIRAGIGIAETKGRRCWISQKQRLCSARSCWTGTALKLRFLNELYSVTKEKILDSAGREPRPWISILIYNHLCMPDPPSPSGEWITFSSVPASHAKDKAWAGHVEDVIARHFSGNVDGLRKACSKIWRDSFCYEGQS